jgi:hypothetical protein
MALAEKPVFRKKPVKEEKIRKKIGKIKLF